MSKYVQLRDSKTGEPIFPVTGSTDITPITDEEINTICDFDGNPEESTIPIATDTVLGCVKVGDGLSVDASGKVSAEFGMELLWENAISESTFQPQGIIINGYEDLWQEFDEIEVEFRPSGGRVDTTSTRTSVSQAVMYGGYIDSSYAYSRRFTVVNNKVSFNSSYAIKISSGVEGVIDSNQGSCVPYRIYGIKGIKGVQ